MPEVKIQVFGSDGRALRWRLTLSSRSGRSEMLSETDGSVVLLLGQQDFPAGVFVTPQEPWHWSIAHGPLSRDVKLKCPRLPDGPAGWWHDTMGLPTDENLGEGICIGVVDSPFKPLGLDGRVSLVHRRDDETPLAPVDPLAHGAQVCSVLVGNPSVPCGYPVSSAVQKSFMPAPKTQMGFPGELHARSSRKTVTTGNTG